MNPKRRSPKQKRSKELVDTILLAAEELIETSSISDLSTNKIAERAGVSIGSLYQYFNNKEEVFRDLIKRRTRQDKEFIFHYLDEFKLEEKKNMDLEAMLEQLISGFHFLVSQQIELRRLIISYAPIYNVQNILNDLKDEVALELAKFIHDRKFLNLEFEKISQRTKLLVYSIEYLIYQEHILITNGDQSKSEGEVAKELVLLAKTYLYAPAQKNYIL